MNVSFKNCGPKPTEQDVKAFEQEAGFEIPSAYRRFLLEVCNGGRTTEPMEYPYGEPSLEGSSDIHTLLGIGHPKPSYQIEDYFESYKDRFTDRLLVVGYDSLNSKICLGINGYPTGSVWYWDWTEQEPDDPFCNLYYICDNFDTFLGLLKPLRSIE